MAEPYRDDETTAPQNPPNSVLNPRVRRAAVWTYIGPLVAFFVAVGVALVYVATRPPDRETKEDENVWSVTGTTGEASPGGRSPDLVPASPEKEIEERGVIRDLAATPAPGVKPEAMLTKLGDMIDAGPDRIIGHHVDVQNVGVTDVESATSFSVQDGSAKVAVVAPASSPAPRNGQRVNIAGTVERDLTAGIRIRASRVDVRQ
jgi:hypothetical protein